MNPADTAPGALRPKSTAQFGYAPPPVPVPGYYTGAANAGEMSAPKYAARTPYTTVQGAGTGGSGLGNWSVGLSSSQIAQVLNSQGLRGPGADIMARQAWRAGANGSPADVSSFLATGMNRRDASALAYLDSIRATTQARDGARFDANLDAYKTSLTERAKLAAAPEVAGFDPSKYYAAKLGQERDAAALANERARVGLTSDTLDAEGKAITVGRDRYNAAAAAKAAPTLGYMPTGEQIHAREMVDWSANATPRNAGIPAGSRTEGYNAEQLTAKRERDAAELAYKNQQVEIAAQQERERRAAAQQGKPVVSEDGRFYWNGKGWSPVTGRDEDMADMAARRAIARQQAISGGAAPDAPAAPAPAPVARAPFDPKGESHSVPADYASKHGLRDGWRGTIGGRVGMIYQGKFYPDSK